MYHQYFERWQNCLKKKKKLVLCKHIKKGTLLGIFQREIVDFSHAFNILCGITLSLYETM